MTISELVEYYDDIFSNLQIVVEAVSSQNEYNYFSEILKVSNNELFSMDVPEHFSPGNFLEVKEFIWNYIESDHEDFPISLFEQRVQTWFNDYTEINFP